MSPLGWHPPYLVDNTDTQYLGDQHWQQCWLFRFFAFLCPSVCLCVNQYVWLLVFTIHLRFLKIQNYWLAQLVYVRFEFMAWVKMHIKMFRNFPKKSGGRYWFQNLGQKNQQSTPACFIRPVYSMVWFCEMFLFCLFSHVFVLLFGCEQLNWKYVRFSLIFAFG